MLTEKQKNFCREYFRNGGNGTQAYLFAYDSKSEVAAANESSLLLKREDIQEYLKTLNRPLERKAISEREKVKKILWDRLQKAIDREDDITIIRITDQINRMNSEYAQVNVNLEEKQSNIDHLDTGTLLKLVKTS